MMAIPAVWGSREAENVTGLDLGEDAFERYRGT